MKRHTSRWISLTAMAGLFASPLWAAGVGDPNGPSPYPNLPLVVPSAPVYQEQPQQQPLPPAPVAQPQQDQGVPAPAEENRFTAAQLQEMVAAIALYPDPLLAQVLAGATYPLDIVQASRFIKANANDPALAQRIAAQSWDPSVQALAHYPSVLSMMDENLEWTQNLGAAFIYQQADLMAAIQASRLQAQAAGNLATTPQQTVVVEERIVYIYPADPQVIYVPVYEPEVVYVPRRPDYVGHTISFGIGFAVGSWLDLDCDWHDHHVYRGGWYQRHHSHHSRPAVNVHVHKDVHVHRDSHDRYDNQPRRVDSHGDLSRDRDDRHDRDERDRRENVWRRDASKPAPQIRSSSQSGARVATSVRPTIDASRTGRDDRDARWGDRTIDRGNEPDGHIRTGSIESNRSRSGYVRPTTGYVRPVTPPVASVPADRRPVTTDRTTPDRTAPDRDSNRQPGTVERSTPWVRPTTADRSDNHDHDRVRGDDRRTAPSLSDSPSAQTGRPAWDRGDLRRSNDSTSSPAATVPRSTRLPTPAVTPSQRPTPSAPAAGPTPAASPSTPVITPQPVPRAPAPAPRIESPAPRAPAPAPRIEQPAPAPRSDARIVRPPSSEPSPRPRIEPERSAPSPAVRSAPSRSTPPPAVSRPAPTRSAPAAPAPSASRSSSKAAEPSNSRASSRPSIASERAAQNAAAREASSKARESRRGR